MYTSAHTYAVASSSHIAYLPSGRNWGVVGKRGFLTEPEAEKKRSVTLAFIAEGPARVLSQSYGTAQGWFLKKWSGVRLEEMRWEGRRNRALGKGGWFSVPLYLENIHRKEHCKDNIITTTHVLPMSTPIGKPMKLKGFSWLTDLWRICSFESNLL